MNTTPTCVILSTAGTRAEAERLAELLVTRQLAACVQITEIASCYLWEGKLVKEPEYLLLIKTRHSLFSEVQAAILANHSYAVPEIVQLPIEQGLPAYLSWLLENTKESGGR